MKFPGKHLSYSGLAAALLLSTSLSSQAATPNAGDLITNTLSLSYDAGGQTVVVPNAATTTFVVDRKVNFAITGKDAAFQVGTAAGASGVLTFELTNSGNAASGYDINVTVTPPPGVTMTYSAVAAATPNTYWLTTSDNPAPGAGETPYDAAGTISLGDVAVSASKYVFVHYNLDTAVPNGTTIPVSLTATALDAGTNTVTIRSPTFTLAAEDTVLADPGADGIEASSESIVISASELSVAKSVIVVEESSSAATCETAPVPGVGVNLPAIPGACIEYTITVSNDAAGATATAISISDVIPSTLTYVSSDVGTFDTESYNSGTNTLTGTVASLPGGQSASMTIRALIGTP